MRRLLLVLALMPVVAGACVLQTETVPGPAGTQGPAGPAGAPADVWQKAAGDAGIYYASGAVGVGTVPVADTTMAVLSDSKNQLALGISTPLQYAYVGVDGTNTLKIRGGAGNTALSLDLGTGDLGVRANAVDHDVRFTVGNSDASHFVEVYPGRSANPSAALSWAAGDSIIFGARGPGPGDYVEHLRITPEGRVGIGTAGNPAPRRLHVRSADVDIALFEGPGQPTDRHVLNISQSGSGILLSTDGTGFLEMRTKGAGGAQLGIDGGGNLTLAEGKAYKPGGGPWDAVSDARLKQNVAPLTSALSTLLRLRGVTFEWKEPEKQGGLRGPQVGMIAQEVEQVVPAWVSVGPGGYKSIGYRGFEAMTVEALRDLKAENDRLQRAKEALEKANREMERRITGFEERLAALEESARRDRGRRDR